MKITLNQILFFSILSFSNSYATGEGVAEKGLTSLAQALPSVGVDGLKEIANVLPAAAKELGTAIGATAGVMIGGAIIVAKTYDVAKDIGSHFFPHPEEFEKIIKPFNDLYENKTC